LACHLWGADQVDGFVIFPGDVPLIKNGAVYTLQPISYFCYDYYFYKTGREGIGHMLMCTPEILLAVAKVADSIGYINENYAQKKLLFKKLGFNVNENVDNKFTGFEKIRHYFSEKYAEVGTVRKFNHFFRINNTILIPNEIQSSTVYIDEFFRDI
jgi:hypothetical protein